jgi:hypothetical protein
VLGERREVGVGARIDVARSLGDPPRNVIVARHRMSSTKSATASRNAVPAEIWSAVRASVIGFRACTGRKCHSSTPPSSSLCAKIRSDGVLTQSSLPYQIAVRAQRAGPLRVVVSDRSPSTR